MLLDDASNIRAFVLLFPKNGLHDQNNCQKLQVLGEFLQKLHLSPRVSHDSFHGNCTKAAPSSGVLATGKKYFILRDLLYLDDFQPYVSRKGSFSGVYMLTLAEIGNHGYSAVRVLGLAPPGVSSNYVLKELIPDIIKCTTQGIEIISESGEPVVVFVDIVGYVGDFPAVTHVLDTMGHNGKELLSPVHISWNAARL